jgi:hypothetical protein
MQLVAERACMVYTQLITTIGNKSLLFSRIEIPQWWCFLQAVNLRSTEVSSIPRTKVGSKINSRLLDHSFGFGFVGAKQFNTNGI